jgi:hypothetical protein
VHQGFRTKDALKFKILTCFYSLIIEHWITLHLTPHILPIFSPNWQIFVMLEVLSARLKSWWASNQRNNVWRFNFIWVLKFWPTSLSTLFPFHF